MNIFAPLVGRQALREVPKGAGLPALWIRAWRADWRSLVRQWLVALSFLGLAIVLFSFAPWLLFGLTIGLFLTALTLSYRVDEADRTWWQTLVVWVSEMDDY